VIFPFLKERVLQTENVCLSVRLSNQWESSISEKARNCRFSTQSWVGIGKQASWNRIRAQLCSKSDWSTRNQWKSSFRKSGPSYIICCGEFESGHRLPQNSIGWLRTNENRLFWEVTFPKSFYVENSNIGLDCVEILLVSQEPIKIDDSKNTPSPAGSMTWIQIWAQFSLKFDWLPENEWKLSFQKTWFPKVIQYAELEIDVCPGMKPTDQSAVIYRVIWERVSIELTWQKQAYAHYLLRLRHRTLSLDNNLHAY
jgi:hypothetical protein